MATNFPSSLDNFTNPVSGNTLDSPSHSLQHSDANDAIEAIEAKLGVGNSPAGSATAGQVLTISAAGTSGWSTPNPGGLSLISSTSFTSVGSHTPGVVFSSTYINYKILIEITSCTSDATLYMKMRSDSTDNSSTYNWSMNGLSNANATVNQSGSVQTTGFFVMTVDTGLSDYYSARIDLFKPFEAVRTTGLIQSQMLSTASVVQSANGGYVHEQAASYNSINLIASAGNMTGRLWIYGYNK